MRNAVLILCVLAFSVGCLRYGWPVFIGLASGVLFMRALWAEAIREWKRRV